KTIAIDRREVERRAARPFGPRLLRIELAGEKAAGERAPREDRDALILGARDDLALDVATGDGVVDLRALESRPAVGLREGDGLHRVPGGQVAEAHVTYLPGADDVVESANGLLDRRRHIDAVDLVEVDVVEAEPLQATVDAREDVRPRQADLVRPRPH